MGRGAQESGGGRDEVRLTPFDQKTIHYFKGFANVKLNNLKAAQADFEKALATGAATAEEKAQMTSTLFGIAASTNQFQKTIDYGKQMVDAGTATPNDLPIIAQSYYQLKDCKNCGRLGGQGRCRRRKAGETPKENLYLFKLQCASDSERQRGDGSGADRSDQAQQQDDVLEYAAAHRAAG